MCFRIDIYSKPYYMCFCMCLFLLLLSMTPYLYASSYLPVRSVKILCVSTCVSSFAHLPASVNLAFHLN